MSKESNNDLVVKTDLDSWFAAMEFDAVHEIKKANGEYEDNELNDGEKNLLRQHFANLKTGLFTQTPMKCPGAMECKYASNCPLAEMGKEPVGDPCPIEKEMYINNVKAYMDQFEIDPISNYSQYKIILDLARQEVYQKRVIELLGDPEYGGLLREYVIGIDQNGSPISSEEINKLFTLLDRVDAKIHRLLKMLVATPQEQYKRDAALKLVKDQDGAAKSLARIKQNTEKLLSKFKEHKRQEEAGETIIDIES